MGEHAQAPSNVDPRPAEAAIHDALIPLLHRTMDAFPDPKVSQVIRWYLEELTELLQPAAPERETQVEVAARKATSKATDESALSLLTRFEDYLEAVLAESRRR